jgi:hypothetical protein
MSISESEWLSRFAAELETELPTPEEIEELLALAGIAAHASERTAAPISCWLVARAGLSPAEARSAAESLSSALESGSARSSS